MQSDSANLAAADSSLICRPDSYVEPLDFSRVFFESRPVEIELGAGDGGFIVQWAALNPDRNFLAVERLLGRLRKVDRKGRRAGLHNLRCLRLEASYFMTYLVPATSVSALHIYYPDPWPKRKQRKHRLINEVFVEAVFRTLVIAGKVYVRTDDENYFAQITLVFDSHSRFARTETPEELAGVLTDFERDFHMQGKATLRGAWVLQS